MRAAKESFACWLAFRLPRRIAYWAAVRVMAHASVVNPTTEVGALTPADCLKAWNK